jgi:hypothetical protein
MKKFLLTEILPSFLAMIAPALYIILLLLLASPLYAAGGMSLMIAGGGSGAAAPSCTVGYDYYTGATYHSALSVGSEDNNYYGGQNDYNPVATHSICAISYKLTAVGFYVAVNTGATYDALPASFLATSSGVTGNNSWSDTEVTFTFVTPVTMSNGTTYKVSLWMDGNSDASNYVSVQYQNSVAVSGSKTWWKKDKSYNNDSAADLYVKFWW